MVSNERIYSFHDVTSSALSVFSPLTILSVNYQFSASLKFHSMDCHALQLTASCQVACSAPVIFNGPMLPTAWIRPVMEELVRNNSA